MPVYEYHCRSCGEQFSRKTHIADYDREVVTCPRCESREVDRVFSDVYPHTARKS